ncbi:hypothetical protein [Verrucomicrobium sp. BvORR106]|uniref:hypothetical protein n=1 Tax=Verrucomicrobium sp. BvORR106 TaxID=1403819 RepID=UPI00056ED90B|nr:hypothetical protein [Verrucomicrobium sp. BvORR106]
MQSVTYAINRPIALFIREILRNTPLAHEWESAVMWDSLCATPAENSAGDSDPPKLHATVSLDLLERLTEAVFKTGPMPTCTGNGTNRREVANFVHRMNITARRRLNAWD